MVTGILLLFFCLVISKTSIVSFNTSAQVKRCPKLPVSLIMQVYISTADSMHVYDRSKRLKKILQRLKFNEQLLCQMHITRCLIYKNQINVLWSPWFLAYSTDIWKVMRNTTLPRVLLGHSVDIFIYCCKARSYQENNWKRICSLCEMTLCEFKSRVKELAACCGDYVL